MRNLSIITVLAIIMAVVFAAGAQAQGINVCPTPAPGVAVPAAPAPNPAICLSTDQLLPLTVREAWQLSGQDYGRFSNMVQSMVNLSLQKRGMIMPDTTAAGQELGTMIRQRAEADPNQLLYSVVDSSVRDYAAAHPQ